MEDEKNQSFEELLKIEYFLVVGMAMTSLKSRFEQLKHFENIFGFLFDINKLKTLDKKELRECCTSFHNTFSHRDSSDINLNDCYSELKVLQSNLPNELMTCIEILEFI